MGHVETLTASDVATGLAHLRAGLNADGYDIEVKGIDDKLHLAIVATPEACADCLVPKPIMTKIFAAALQEQQADLTEDDIIVEYPAEH